MAPEGVDIAFYEGLAGLPPFDPGLDLDPTDYHAPEPVVELRRRLLEADGLLLCSPEYAFGMPGVLKNLLDWTVSMNALDRMPIAFMVASPLAGGGAKAHQGLLWVLRALNVDVVKGASFRVDRIRTRMNQDGQIIDPPTARRLAKALEAVVNRIKGLR